MGSKQPSAPPPPSPAETTRQSIQAQVESLPEILEAQREFAPQFTQEELDLLRDFGGQFLQEQLELEKEFAPQITQLTREQQEILAPERIAGQEALEEFLTREDVLTEAERGRIQQQARAAQSVRGLAETGFGALDEARQLADLRRSLQSERINVALSAAGRVPTTGGFQTQTPNVSQGQLVQNVSPQDIFSLTNNNFSNLTNQFATKSRAATEQRAQNIGLGSDVAGAALSFAALCWVASEVYGGWTKSETIKSRMYITNLAPKWFKNLYLKHGAKFAQYISDKPLIKKAIKPIFDWFGKQTEKVYG